MSARRGQATTGLIATACVFVGLGTVAIVARPGALRGEGQAVEATTSDVPEHQTIIDHLAGLIDRGGGILAIHDRERDPLLDIIVWSSDDVNPGVIDADEIGVVSHSRLTRTIVYRWLDPDTDEAIAKRGGRPRPDPPAGDPRDPAYAIRWRASEAVSTVTIGRGISDMQVRRIGRPGESDHLEIALTWPPETVDGPDKASILVAVSQSEISAKE